jgi:hypothetical protein
VNKKVRYALGVAGAAPVLGMMIPALPATAAASAAPVKAKSKTVSLRHARVAPASGCTGHTGTGRVYNQTSRAFMQFWHTNNAASGVCIGTVSFHLFDPLTSSARIRIYAHSAGSHHDKVKVFSKFVPGSDYTYGVHTSYSDRPVQVCVAGVSSGGRVSSPACRSVS